MKTMMFVTIALFLVFTFSAFGQTNPADRPGWSRGVILNFEETADLVEEVPIQQFDCDGIPIFEPATNPMSMSTPADYSLNSTNVGKITTTACTWEGIYLDKEFVLDFSIRPLITIDVYAPAAGKRVAVKLESWTDNTVNKQVEAVTTVAEQWERLVFDFSGTESNKYGRIVLMMDFEGTTVGDVYYFDNIRQGQPPITYDTGLIEDFETPNKIFWGDWSGCEFTIDDNPDTSGINKSKKVGVFYTTTEQWEGACNAERYFPLDFDAAGGGSIKIKVNGPVDRILMVKLENAAGGGGLNPIEFQMTLTSDYEWEEIEYDFTDKVFAMPEETHYGFYDRISVFPDFLSAIAGEDWYIDDLIWTGQPTRVAGKPTPGTFQLFARNYPNPFNPTTTISYSIPTASKVELTVYDVLGRNAGTLVNETQAAGSYDFSFNGSALPSGTYFYKLTAGTQTFTGKMLLVK
jgi:hypothetical protein